LLSLLPLIFIVAVAIAAAPRRSGGWCFGRRWWELLANTFWLELLTLPLTIVLGVALAWVTERTDLAGCRAGGGARGGAPLAVPAFVQSYAWSSAFPSLHGLWGAVVIAVVSYFRSCTCRSRHSFAGSTTALEDGAPRWAAAGPCFAA
jgi:iron(III) transport system permease protein